MLLSSQSYQMSRILFLFAIIHKNIHTYTHKHTYIHVGRYTHITIISTRKVCIHPCTPTYANTYCLHKKLNALFFCRNLVATMTPSTALVAAPIIASGKKCFATGSSAARGRPATPPPMKSTVIGKPQRSLAEGLGDLK